MRVAALMDTPILSGPGRQLAAVARALAARDVAVRVLTFQRRGRPASPFAAFLREAGVDCVVLDDHGPLDAGLAGRLREALEAFDPDVVQTHSYRPTALAWWLRRRGARWAWVGFHHGATQENWKVRAYHALDDRLIRHADRLVVMSEPQRRRFADVGDRVLRIANAVLPGNTTATLAPALAEAMAPLPRPLVACIGRLSHEKGVDILLEAFAQLAARGPAPSLVIAGDGPDRAALERRAAELGLAHVRFLGTVTPVEPLYGAVDCVVLPSRSEGLPNVLLEALRADRAVVATAVGAVPEVLADREAGGLVPAGDATALADAIAAELARLGDPARSAARQRTAARYALETRVQAHVDLYASLVPAARRPAAREPLAPLLA